MVILSVLFVVTGRGVASFGFGLLLSGRGERGRGVRGVGQFGLSFFAGMDRRLHAPLALVAARVRLLLDGDGSVSGPICSGVLGLRGRTSSVQGRVDRLLSFRGLSRGRVHLSIRRGGLVPFLSRICLSFGRRTRTRGVGCLFAADYRSTFY